MVVWLECWSFVVVICIEFFCVIIRNVTYLAMLWRSN